MRAIRNGRRNQQKIVVKDLAEGLQSARRLLEEGSHLKAFDCYEQLLQIYPNYHVEILSEVYDKYQICSDRDRYSLYQERLFNFGLSSSDKVLDIGSGHIPFPLATHLADISFVDDSIGRAGLPFKYLGTRPVYECNIEKLPFKDNEFDFVYCSHVLEHVENPEMACSELMRVAKRGFIETPKRAKDLWLNTAKISNHRWGVEYLNNKLVFHEYAPLEINGVSCDILMNMHCAPQTQREKAFSALIYIKADFFNTMVYWENSFDFEVQRFTPKEKVSWPTPTDLVFLNEIKTTSPIAEKPCVFMQVHTFYPPYLESFYIQNPISATCPFDEQVNKLVRDGFSANHMIAPYLGQHGYETHLIIANNHHAQEQWARENAVILETSDNRLYEITRKQIETIKPDILYLSDPITFDSKFIRSLAWRPRLIMGWRAADIPQGTDWSEFDVMLSCLTGLRDAARRLGAKSTEHFFPGFPVWMNSQISTVQPDYDVVFAGSWTPEQHRSRNALLQAVADNSAGAYSCGYFINSGNTPLPPSVSAINQGPRFGTEMYKTLRSGRIVLDARARHLYFDLVSNQYVDMGRNETANMRIFEVTGCGSFLLTEFFDNLGEFFEIGKEIETFRDSDEMLRKIRYYLDHPDEREAIARRGQERCLRDYSMEKRTAEFDRIIQKHFAAKNADIEISPTDVNEMLHRASGLLAAGDTSGAFGLLAKAKAGKQPISGIDLLRARCFLKMGQPEAAIEALREELRWFPENQDAARLLDELLQMVPNKPVEAIDDAEFQQVLAQIKPYTMLSEQRLYSLYTLARSICVKNIPGNFVECGVAAGGSSALLAWVIKKYSRQPRKLFAFDSFSGMPHPTEEDRHQGVDAEATGWGTGTCSAPEESVKAICMKLGVADVLVTVKGYFEETLPRMANWVGMIALLHMDGDWYESTKSILENFYGQLSNNAIIQIDDYGYWDGCRKAIHEFEATHSTHFELKPIDGTGVWCVKPDCFSVNLSISASLIEDFLEDDPVPQGITTQMSANERFQLYYTIRTLNLEPVKVFRFVEIGSYGGGSLLLICRALKRRGMPFQGISIEPGGTPQFRQVLNLLGNSVIHLPMFSHEASRQLSSLFSATQPPGFILVDGDHTYQGVRQDIIDYYPLLAPGGTMLFHDYLPPLDERNREFIFAHHANTEPGIRQACLEMIEETYGLAPLDLPLLYPTDPAQTQAHLPIIPGVYSTIRGYQKPI